MQKNKRPGLQFSQRPLLPLLPTSNQEQPLPIQQQMTSPFLKENGGDLVLMDQFIDPQMIHKEEEEEDLFSPSMTSQKQRKNTQSSEDLMDTTEDSLFFPSSSTSPFSVPKTKTAPQMMHQFVSHSLPNPNSFPLLRPMMYSNSPSSSMETLSIASSHSTSFPSKEDYLQQQILLEKKKKRRESHNAVERRRRDQINEKIHELSQLVPDCQNEKGQKGMILKKSTDYIRQLQQSHKALEERVRLLEKQLGDQNVL